MIVFPHQLSIHSFKKRVLILTISLDTPLFHVGTVKAGTLSLPSGNSQLTEKWRQTHPQIQGAEHHTWEGGACTKEGAVISIWEGSTEAVNWQGLQGADCPWTYSWRIRLILVVWAWKSMASRGHANIRFPKIPIMVKSVVWENNVLWARQA